MVEDGNPPPVAAMEQEARCKLFDDVSQGRMTPQEAEVEAARQGLEPLRPEPDISHFNPMAEAIWTLPMAVAWIVWRTPESVRENWDAYCRECWDWIPHHNRVPVDGGRDWVEIAGWSLCSRNPKSLTLLGLVEALGDDDERKLVSVKTARCELWNRLSADNLTAAAISEASVEPVQIAAHEWTYLTYQADRALSDRLAYEHQPLDVVYRNVTFRRADVCRLWPPMVLVAPTVAGESACQHWLECEMRQSPDIRPMSKDDYKAEVAKRFRVSARGFDRAWSAAIVVTQALAWSRAGAPKKSPH